MYATQKLTPDDLLKLLYKTKGATPVTLVTETYPATKAGSPHIMKRSEVNGLLHVNYEAAVNRQREREGKDPDFCTEKPVWGDQFAESCIKLHMNKETGELRRYVTIGVQGRAEPVWFRDGQKCELDDIKQFLPSSKPSKKQGTAKPIEVRTYEITPGRCRVKGLAINNEAYLVEDKQ